jgi:hypothetical protein
MTPSRSVTADGYKSKTKIKSGMSTSNFLTPDETTNRRIE